MNDYAKKFAKWMCKNHSDEIPPLIKIERKWENIVLEDYYSARFTRVCTGDNEYFRAFKEQREIFDTMTGEKFSQTIYFCQWHSLTDIPIQHNNRFIKQYDNIVNAGKLRYFEKKQLEKQNNINKEYERSNREHIAKISFNRKRNIYEDKVGENFFNLLRISNRILNNETI